MTDDQTFIVGEVLPRIASVSFHKDFQVTVTWEEGSRAGQSDVIDLGPAVMTHKIYAPLRDDPDFFRTVHVINYGSALGWGDGEEIDMSAEGVEDLAEQAMTASDFRLFMERHSFTQEAAAAQLGISRRQVNYFLTSKVIPRTIALACAGLNAQLINQNRNPTNDVDVVNNPVGLLDHSMVFYTPKYTSVYPLRDCKYIEGFGLLTNSECTVRLSGRPVPIVSLVDIKSGKADLAALAANKPVIVKP
ncbi:hypothetical protein D3273_24680 [Lichenibacterium minor]|uniref:DUF2442 domain-containing protein n=1 Tax=Lichenibacterium minor TaxID=2316528 RepID=A0A4Q2TZU6_9HYPH|nr:hypothetical protein [Lichenibacterium minor]RYC29310.1 hypothetical protein D3273_24680 [Lichenibacterium minor]